MAISEITKELTNNLESLLQSNDWITAKEVNIRGCEGRPDIVAVRRKQYLRKEIRAYEVKVSRSDFLSDVGRMKWKKYLSVCHRVYFAAPAGILKKSDIPEGAGLIVFSENGWSVVKTARSFEPTNLDVDAVLSILFANNKDMKMQRNLRERLIAKGNITLKGVADKIGGEIARRVRGCTPETETEADRIMTTVNKHFSDRVEATKALKFAAALIRHVDVVESISTFLREMTNSIGPETVELTAKKVKKTKKELDKDNPLGLILSDIKGVIGNTINDKKGDDLAEIESLVKRRFNTGFDDLLEVEGYHSKDGGIIDG